MPASPVVGVISMKGGAGKTFTSVFLARAAALEHPDKKIVLLDADPQGSATDWVTWANTHDDPMGFDAVLVDRPHTVEEAVRVYRDGADIIIIDTPPGNGGDRDVVVSTIKASDGVIIPCEPCSIEMTELVKTVRLAEAHRAATIAILRNRVNTQVLESKTFQDDLEAAGFATFAAQIRASVAIKRFHRRTPTAATMFGYDRVWREIMYGPDLDIDD